MKSIVFCMWIIWLIQPASSSRLGFSFDHFDHQDLIDVAKLCHVAYGQQSPYTSELENLGWHIESLTATDHTCCGIKATNGPLCVMSFKGTDDLKSLCYDFDAVKLSSQNIYPDFPPSVIHRGFYDYYQTLGINQHLRHFDDDEFLVLSGHSLGGAVCHFAALDLLIGQKKSPFLYPTDFCSMLTLGAPATLGKELAYAVGAIPHLRIAFDNDPVTLLTRGNLHQRELFCRPDSQECVFTHTAHRTCLYGTNPMNHGCAAYLNDLMDLARRDIYGIWEPWQEEKEPLYYPCPYLGSGIGFNCTDAKLLSNFRTLTLPPKIAQCVAWRLSSSWWHLQHPQPFSNRAWHPQRCADTLFYQVWRTENLGCVAPGDTCVLSVLKNLHIKYNFLSEVNRQNALRYFHRFLKTHPEDIEGLSRQASELPLPPTFEDNPFSFLEKGMWLAEQKRQNSMMACWFFSPLWFMPPKNLLYDFFALTKYTRKALPPLTQTPSTSFSRKSRKFFIF